MWRQAMGRNYGAVAPNVEQTRGGWMLFARLLTWSMRNNRPV